MNNKTKYIIALFGICLLNACKSNDELPMDSEDASEISLMLNKSSVSVFQTRGTGTVGGTTAETNLWNNENLYILMTTIPGSSQPTWGYTVTDKLGEQFNGTFYCRPQLKSGEWYMNYEAYDGHQKKYYPTDGTRSDFFAFYLDDAADNTNDGNPIIETINAKDTVKIVRFTLDGSQDLLAGKAIKTAADSLLDTKRGYSAKTSRLGIIPDIHIQHLLTRFTFGVLPGSINAEGVILKSINMASQNKGKLTVAYNEDRMRTPDELIEWSCDTVGFALKECANEKSEDGKPVLKDLDPITLHVSQTAETSVGEAMFVKPNEKSYVLYVTYLFDLGADKEPLELTAELPVTLGEGKLFQQGCSYHVCITINGLSDIVLKTSLESWKDGGNINLETDEYLYPSHKN